MIRATIAMLAFVVVVPVHPVSAQRPDSEAWEVGVAAALMSAALVLDQPAFSRGADSTFAHSTVGRVAQRLGHPVTYAPALGMTWLLATLAGSDGTANAAWHTAAALAASVALTGGIKIAVGRARPTVAAGDADEFHAFSTSRDYQAFPSGHATTAFAVAASLTEETHRWEVGVPAYAAAAVVAWSRVAASEHWVSDVVGGGVLGVMVTQGVMRSLHADARSSHPHSAAAPLYVGASIPF